MTSIPLSVLVRTLNEADRIGAALASAAALGGEIVVIDAGSTDDTTAVARAHGARVIHNPWPGFGTQRRFGEEQCTNDFIFSLDADEVLPPDLVAEVRAHFLSGEPPRLMIVRKASIFPHHERPPPLPFCHEQVLIYDRRIARTNPHPNWDTLDISTSDRPVRLQNPLWHYSLRDWEHASKKAVYVAKLAATTMSPKPRAYLVLRLVTEFPAVFFKYYVMRRYFLGGVAGFTNAVVGAFGRWLRIAMMLEQRDRGSKPK